MSAIVTENLAKSYGDVEAVKSVDLAVADGEIYGFLGPNGAGKSTCVRMLCTLLRPTSGRAVVAGHNVADAPAAVRRSIGVALQASALDPRQSGRELLDLQGRYFGLDAARRASRVKELIELIDIGDAIDRRASTYSGGMARRLDLAVALVHEPKVLFLDEPTTGLDPASRALVWREVDRLRRELGMTIFLTTQYLEEADMLADRVGILSGGVLAAEGTPEELKRAVGLDVIVARVEGECSVAADAVRSLPMVRSVSVHGGELTVDVADGPGALSPVAVALAQAGVRVTGLELRQPTLDDVFLDVTGTRLPDAVVGASK
jgi:ABC-2 type transport system ATP-binding protein